MFEERTKNLPENVVNTMISYGYATLYCISLALKNNITLCIV